MVPQHLFSTKFAATFCLHYSGSYDPALHVLAKIQNMAVANLDIPGTIALADEIITLLVHTTLLDDLDLHVEEVSQCTVLYHLMRYAS